MCLTSRVDNYKVTVTVEARGEESHDDLKWGLSKGSLIRWQSLNRRGVQFEYSHNIPLLRQGSVKP